MEQGTLTKLQGRLLFVASDTDCPLDIYRLDENLSLKQLDITQNDYVLLKEMAKYLNVRCSYLELRFKSELLEYNNLLNEGVDRFDERDTTGKEYRLRELHNILIKRYNGSIPGRVQKSDEERLRELEAKGIIKYATKEEIPKTSDYDEHREYFTIYNRLHKQKSRAKDATVPKRQYTRQKGRNVRQNISQEPQEPPKEIVEVIEQPGFILEVIEKSESIEKPGFILEIIKEEEVKDNFDQNDEMRVFELLSIIQLEPDISPDDWKYINSVWDIIGQPGRILTDLEERMKNDIIQIYKIGNRGPFYESGR